MESSTTLTATTPLQSSDDKSDPETRTTEACSDFAEDEEKEPVSSAAITRPLPANVVPTVDGDEVKNNHHDVSPPPPRPEFQMGDHVYSWCSFWGIPAVFAHHGIVLNVFYDKECSAWRLRVVDFSKKDRQPSKADLTASSLSNKLKEHTEKKDGTQTPKDSSVESSSNPNKNNSSPPSTTESSSSSSPTTTRLKSGCTIRVYDTDPATWHRVTYQATLWREQWSRSGTATRTKADPPGMVRARVQFLLDNHHDATLIPPYDAVRSNSECVAVWCKTGTWATLQATSWLSAMAAGQVKSTATLVGAAASTQVTVQQAGLWGWMGYTTQVSLLSTQPWLVPALAGYGIVTIGGPAMWLALAQRHWKKLTQKLNTAFWQAAMDHPDAFCEHLMEWSAAGEHENFIDVNNSPHSTLTQGNDDMWTGPASLASSLQAAAQSPTDQVEELSLLQQDSRQESSKLQSSLPESLQFPSEEPTEG